MSLTPPATPIADSGRLVLRCRGCRKVVFEEDNIITHEPENKGQLSFSYKKRDMNGASTLCTSYFIEPPAWLQSSELSKGDIEGKIGCPNPKCKQKLGSYHWQGSQCSCGAWIVPGIMVAKKNVDETRI
ncbi:hypothetical protein BKA69DRAFT_1091178, partial [Paraphysoderma sedebokerense]